jgi:phospholipid transport system substrate-binding protein
MPKPLRRIGIGLIAALLAAVALASAPARASADGPEAFVQDVANRAIAVLSDQSKSEQDQIRAFRQMFRQAADLPKIARFTLGRYWRSASESERTEFVNLFEDYMLSVYSERFNRYSGEQIEVTGARDEGDRGILVTSMVSQASGPGLHLDWRVEKDDGGNWRITDVVVEGVSMMITHRSEFASVIRSKGGEVSGLNDVLRQKISDNVAATRG